MYFLFVDCVNMNVPAPTNQIDYVLWLKLEQPIDCDNWLSDQLIVWSCNPPDQICVVSDAIQTLCAQLYTSVAC